MSFSAEQKNQIITEQYKGACCRRAILNGILLTKAYAENNRAFFTLEKNEYCDFAAKLIYEFFGRNPEISTSKSGGRRKIVSFDSKSATKYIYSLDGKSEFFSNRCQGCACAFLRGVFLACGNLSDPERQYLLEFSPSYNTEHLLDFLAENSFSPKLTVRKNKKVIYFKRASEIEDFCGFLGLTEAMFKITNTQIKREFLNNTNRVVNCETNNIEKAVSASAKQIEAINELIKHNLLSNLPDELEYTARLRVQNESLSLSQLSKLFTPPISKSGLSHRLTKIIEFADQLLKKAID